MFLVLVWISKSQSTRRFVTRIWKGKVHSIVFSWMNRMMMMMKCPRGFLKNIRRWRFTIDVYQIFMVASISFWSGGFSYQGFPNCIFHAFLLWNFKWLTADGKDKITKVRWIEPVTNYTVQEIRNFLLVFAEVCLLLYSVLLRHTSNIVDRKDNIVWLVTSKNYYYLSALMQNTLSLISISTLNSIR